MGEEIVEIGKVWLKMEAIMSVRVIVYSVDIIVFKDVDKMVAIDRTLVKVK